jgi:deoxyribodipyrimidine photo-lyase
MRRNFADRQALVAYLAKQFPAAAAVSPHVAATRGGRKAAGIQLARIRPGREYAATRNHLDGAVTRLSPYLRHGVLGLAEVRDIALGKVNRPSEAGKFTSELAWRDYFQRVYRVIGEGIWEDREPIKTGLAAPDYAGELSEDIRQGNTGLACIDAFSRELVQTGYLHNHARMWMAAYVVHWRRIKWQAGARWFLEHLLDGDPASNNLSWQWVASTFSHKSYIFNRQNLEQYTGGVYCQRCPLKGHCDFEGSYETLAGRLFPGERGVAQPAPQPQPNLGAGDLAHLGEPDGEPIDSNPFPCYNDYKSVCYLRLATD